MPPRIRPSTRYDHATGLHLPAFTADERLEMRARAMRLLEIVAAGKATAKEEAELIELDRDLYGPGSGWEPDPIEMQHAEAIGRKVREGLAKAGRPALSSRDVLRRGLPDGAFVDAYEYDP